MNMNFRVCAVLVACVAVWPSMLLHAQEAGETSILENATPLVVGRSVSLQSSVLDENRMLLIYLPGGH